MSSESYLDHVWPCRKRRDGCEKVDVRICITGMKSVGVIGAMGSDG